MNVEKTLVRFVITVLLKESLRAVYDTVKGTLDFVPRRRFEIDDGCSIGDGVTLMFEAVIADGISNVTFDAIDDGISNVTFDVIDERVIKVVFDNIAV